MKLNSKILLLLFVTCLAGQGGLALAQDEQSTEATTSAVATADSMVDDVLNRGTPRRSAIGFMESAANLDWDRAAEYLDLRNLPPEVKKFSGKELARQLNQVLARSVWIDDYSVSDDPEGSKGDGLPAYRDLLVTVKLPDGEEVPIWLQLVPRGDGQSIWKISNRSVSEVPELYDVFSYPPFVEDIRQWFPEDVSFLGLEAFKWFLILVAAAIAWPVIYFGGWLLSRIFSSPKKATYPLVRHVFTGPLTALGILVVIGAVINELGAGAYAQLIMRANTLSTIVFVWIVWSILTLTRKHFQEKMYAANRPGAAKLLRPITILVKITLVIFALLFWLNNLGVNITTVLAGLGVGGLAVALALQKPIEDLMGALSIFSQASVRVGDFCRFGSHMGTIEDIGLRTTRMRTLTNSVISIPNSKLAYLELENLSYRKKIRYWPTIRLRYDTTEEQIRQICADIVERLESNENVYVDDGVRARFTDLGEDAILIKIHCFLKTTDFPESLGMREQLNFIVMSVVQEAGAEFALPGRAIQFEQPVSLTQD